MKRVIKQGANLTAQCAAQTGLIRFLENFGERRSKFLRVLTYHRVDKFTARPELYPNLISATPSEFASQIQCLASNFHVTSMEEVCAAALHGASLPPRSVAITFDDAYADFAEHAWPILKSYKLPVTVFVPTDYPDRRDHIFWWDRVYAAVRETKQDSIRIADSEIMLNTPSQRRHAMKVLVGVVKSLPDDTAQDLIDKTCSELRVPPPRNDVLGWESLRQLAVEGVTLAPHTRKHPLLNRVDASRVEVEISGSFADLQREIGEVLPVFAYPSGAYNEQVIEALPRLGVKLAFTTCRGLNDLNHCDRMRIRRFNIGRGTSAALLRTQLLPWMHYLNRWHPLPESN